ncbi:ead/Ea22-like family protein [Enterobacter hormaechei subsp. xiangfangensis]
MSNIDKRALLESAESTINILENIAGFEPSDIDGDTVELRFETEDGFDTGCDVSIVDQCQKAADVVQALLEELEAKDKRNERALSLLKDASPENVWEIIGRLKVVISGDYRSEAEIAAAAGKGE